MKSMNNEMFMRAKNLKYTVMYQCYIHQIVISFISWFSDVKAKYSLGFSKYIMKYRAKPSTSAGLHREYIE